jgi:DNA-directed RNA polymerase subunit beta'
MDDMVIPDKKKELIDAAQEELQRVVDQYQEGLITDGERYNKIVDIWAGVADRVTEEMMDVIGKEILTDPETGKSSEESSFNPVYIMADSGARGSTQQMRQLAAMRGLMAKPSGEIIETPITANFREGLTVLQYFVSTHGARKGLADTALKTANSGYLTRRLVDVAQDAVVSEYDCGTLDGIRVAKLEEAGEVIQPLGDRILGRVVLDDVVDPLTGEVLVKHNTELDEATVKQIEEAGIEEVVIRSVLTCQTKRGVCARCYGRDLARGYRVNIGEAVGIIAAQSIGEPGTQLTMRTFHIGGAAARGKIEQSSLEARTEGLVRLRNAVLAKRRDGRQVVMNRHGELVVMDDTGREREHHRLVYGAELRIAEGDKVKSGQLLAEWDPFAMPILTEVAGQVKYGDLVEGVTITEKLDEVTGLSRKVVIESRAADLRPRISIKEPQTGETKKIPGTSELEARYLLPVGSNIVAQEGDLIDAGEVLAKIPRDTTKVQDITGGLPRVAELFEARKPKDHAIISEIDGEVSMGKDTKGKRKVVITPLSPDGLA